MGSIWDPFGDPKSSQKVSGDLPWAVWISILYRLVPRWPPSPSQEGSWGVLRPSGGGLGPLLGALGPSLEGLGALFGCLEAVLGCSWGLLGSLGTVLAAHEAINGSFWVVLECDSLIQFIDSIY